MIVRLAVVVALVAVFAIGRYVYERWRAGLHAESRPVPRLPLQLVEGAARTWVVFTTPYCGSCHTVESQLRAADPDARVVRVDATRDTALAGAFHVRSSPTVLLADAVGDVRERLVGPEAVAAYVGQ